jgi:protein MpaA
MKIIQSILVCCGCLLTILPSSATSVDGRSQYERDVTAWCDQLSAKLQGIETSSCKKYPYKLSQIRSVNNNIIPFIDIGSTDIRENLRVLVIGGIHGDEWTAISLVFHWLNWIPEGGMQNTHWRIVPLSNPDGFHVRPSTRTNANGVDLNRNFPTPDWVTMARRYWVTRTDMNPRRNPGPSANSEPETQLIVQHIEQYKPHVILSLHAPYGLIDFDGPEKNAPLRFGLLPLKRLGVFPGSMGNYAGVHLGIPVVTVELENARQMPSVKEVRRMWDDLLKWLEAFSARPVQ